MTPQPGPTRPVAGRHILLSDDWFPAVVTAVDGDEYEFEEVWLDGDGDYVTKVGGRVATALNPGKALSGTFAEDDYAMARLAAGAGGTLWEMLPVSEGSGGTTLTDTLSGNFNFNNFNTWNTVSSLGITLTAGTWLITAVVSGGSGIPGAGTNRLQARLYDNTAGAQRGPVAVIAESTAATAVNYGTATICWPVTVTGDTDIVVQALNTVSMGAGGSWITALGSPGTGAGDTTLAAAKLA